VVARAIPMAIRISAWLLKELPGARNSQLTLIMYRKRIHQTKGSSQKEFLPKYLMLLSNRPQDIRI